MAINLNLDLFLMVFMRMSGAVLFNPIFGRRNIPTTVRIALSFLLALFTYSVIPAQAIEINSVLIYMVILVKELLVGLIVGFIMQIFMSVIILGGEIIDYQTGISMSKIYDPQSNVSMPVSASILNAMFILLFFAANGHTTLIQIFVQLGTISPYGEIGFELGMYQELAGLFSIVLVYSIKLALPILAVGFIVEMGVGLIMKAVPQINVFVINIQLKVLIGFIAILILVPAFASFLERLTTLMFDKMSVLFGL